MKKSVVNIEKMGLTILTVMLNLLLLINGASSTCVQVPNRDMMQYSCTGGNPSDLYLIPETTEKIRIQNMSIPRITSNTFSRFGGNLVVLICTYCGINDIEPNAFRSLVNLQHLVLDNNRLRDVKSSWFEGGGRGMPDLTYVDLNYNEISHIEDDVYKNLPGLVELRISGNRLECLNLDAMSKLNNFERIILSKNPDFKCPNAVSKFLEDRQVNFERDPEWRRIEHDLVPASVRGPSADWRKGLGLQTSTDVYRGRLIAMTTEVPPPYKDHNYEDERPSTESENSAEIDPYYRNRGWPATSSPTPYPYPYPYPPRERPSSVGTSEPTNREWSPGSMPTSEPTNREWSPVSMPTPEPTNREWSPASVPNSYPTTGDWRTEPVPSSAYPPLTLPTMAPSDSSHRDRTEWRVQPEVPRHEDREHTTFGRDEIYGHENYSPDTMHTSTVNSMNEARRMEEDTLPSHGEQGVVTYKPPHIEWTDYPDEVFAETDFSRHENVESTSPGRQTNSPSIGDYLPNVHQYPGEFDHPGQTGHPEQPEDIYQPSQHSVDASRPQILEKYQQVQEPVSVTIPPTKKENEKAEDSTTSSSTSFGASFVVLAIGVVLTIQ